MEQVEQAAPAPIESPTPVVVEAPEGFDVTKYREAQRAEAEAPAVPDAEPAKVPEVVTKPVEPAPAPESTLSKRQQEANDRTRRAIEQAHADLITENARLRAQLAPKSDTPAPAPTKTDHKRFLALPDAPKLADFDSVEEYTSAMGLFIADKRYDERQAHAQREAEHTKTQTEIVTRDTAFRTRLAEAKKSNPDFLETIDPEIVSLRPYDALTDGERPSAANELAEQILRSEHGPQLMVHLTQNPDAKRRLLDAPDKAAFYLELGKVHAALDMPAPAPSTPTISSAPPPPTTLGRKTVAPNDADRANAAGDVRAWRKAQAARD